MSESVLHIIGGGLAGCEAAWVAARLGFSVRLYEMRPERMSAAHQSDGLAELVCSNSFRSDDDEYNAVGLLHWEMRLLGSLVMAAADEHRLPAGSALAVDREGFSQSVTRHIESHPLIEVRRCHVSDPHVLCGDDGIVIISAGPLASSELSDWIKGVSGGERPAFFDAIAPIVHYDSIDLGKVWRQSRYDKGEGQDYLNCPLTRGEYESFVSSLLSAGTTEFKEWEQDTPYFEACLPIEVMASRGIETLRYGCMKPVGLTNPHAINGEKPYAVVQLRQDNKLGTLWNMVGFQTKMKHSEQVGVLRMISGLEGAEFARLGGIHRNSYIDSPRLLGRDLSLLSLPNIYFAGQITGVEGYVESAACGIMAGLFGCARLRGGSLSLPPETCAIGGLLRHISGDALGNFQPMNINFGLLPPIDGVRLRGRDKKLALSQRSKVDFGYWLDAEGLRFGDFAGVA